MISFLIIKPAMPDQVFLLTGSENSAYYDLGQQIAAELKRKGLDATVVVTDGALENVATVSKNDRSVALAPSMIDWQSEAGVDVSHLTALGSIAYEPLWLFYRADIEIARIPDLAGKTVATEGQGSSSGYVTRQLLAQNGISNLVSLKSVDNLTLQTLIDGFAEKTIDALIVTGELESPLVQSLMNSKGVRLLSFERSAAYSELIPGITRLIAPEGLFNLAKNIPAQDVELLSNTTCLIANENLHPTVVSMLLVSSERVGKQTDTFTSAVHFPNSSNVTLPLHSAARRFFQQGETGLTRYLPYKLTRFLNHLGYIVLPLLTLVIVLLKLVPTALRLWAQFRLKSLFKRLVAVEKGHTAGMDKTVLLADLQCIDQESSNMFMPLSTVHDYIDFRQFLHDLRERVEQSE